MYFRVGEKSIYRFLRMISSMFFLIGMVSVIKKLLLILGLEKMLDSESTFEVVRHFAKCVGENKIV